MRLGFEVELEGLSGIGDGLVNLIYSISLSNALKAPMGKKASNYILSQGLKKSGFRERAGMRKNRHNMGDFVESIIFFAWAKGMMNMEEAVEILEAELKGVNNDRMAIREASIKAFARLIKEVGMRLWGKEDSH